MEDYFPEEADMLIIEPTSDDIGRYIEERLRNDLGTSGMDKKLRVDIRGVVLKRIAGMYRMC